MRYVLIADDHEVTRRGLRELLSETFGGVVVHEVADAQGVEARLPEHPWDLLLLDVMMPGSNVLEVIRHVRAHSAMPILILTAATEIEYVTQTMQAGANGLVHKHRTAEELIEAVRCVASGGAYLHAETAAAVASGLRGPEPGGPPHESLSERELTIFRKIALGLAVKEIAGELGLSDKTVATYLARIRKKTGLSSHVEIARYALQRGLVD